MSAVALNFERSARCFAVLAAVFAALFCLAVAGWMSTLLVIGHIASAGLTPVRRKQLQIESHRRRKYGYKPEHGRRRHWRGHFVDRAI
jgi:hypothetical protein